MGAPICWDAVEGSRRTFGHIDATWFDLGRAAGSRTVGVRRLQVEPGAWSTPAHRESAEEEIFYVLGGDGVSWQDGRVCAVRAGDCLVHLAGAEVHSLRAGADGLDVLAFGERADAGTLLPRAGVAWIAGSWTEAGGEHPFALEAAQGPPEVGELGERPAGVRNLDEVEEQLFSGGEGRCRARRRDLGRRCGSLRSGLKHLQVEPGHWSAPAHCHAEEEEIFVVLGGGGTLLLGNDEHGVARGSIVARPAGTGIAHAFQGGAEGLELLAYGSRRPNDITYYPRSGKVFLRGIGLIGRIERLEYWDGE